MRRLLLGGDGSFTPPTPPPPASPVTLTTAPNGGNNPWQIPGGIYHSGIAYIGYIDGNGNVEGIEYNEASGVVSGPYTIHSNLEDDAHSSPSFVRRSSDGKFITIYSRHNNTPINVRVSTNADSFNGWSAATNLDSQLGGTRYTDQQLYEYDGLLYLFYRDEPTAGTDSRWVISTCDPATPTSGWAAQTRVYRQASARTYVITAIDVANGKLHFIATNSGTTAGGVTGFSRLGHFYLDLDAGTYHKTDGTGLTLPLTYSMITEAYVGPSGTDTVFASTFSIDSSGNPVVACSRKDSGDSVYFALHYNGSAWITEDLGSGDPGYVYGGGSAQAYGTCVDDGDPNVIYTLELDGSFPEVIKNTTVDGWATHATEQLTSGSSALQVQIIPIRGPQDLRAFWHYGTWTSYTNWNTGLKGLSVP